MSTQHHTLEGDGVNKNVRNIRYAVRGEIVIRAEEIKHELANGSSKYPFKDLIFCNIGNPQAVGQKAITWPQQVLALLNYPALLEKKGIFPSDVVERATTLLKAMPRGLGPYSTSKGVLFIRESVARFIEQRDGFPADPDQIFLTDGASPGIKTALKMLVRNPSDGIMLPNPQYPLYSATLDELGGAKVPYDLDQKAQWGISEASLEKSLKQARAKGINVRALVVINPGNPTGQCLSEREIRTMIKFCAQERLVLLADEVYQTNVYDKENLPFVSFKKVLRTMEAEAGGVDGKNGVVELFSFHSASKGILGECGRRGGYMELTNIHPQTSSLVYTLQSVSLCSNTVGQVMIQLMVTPPVPGEPSFELYHKETTAIYESLKRRAKAMVIALNSMEGITCQPALGAMYVFPQIELPHKAVVAAQAAGKTPDTFYCLSLLNATGIVIVPGAGFLINNNEDTKKYYFRGTFLPQEDQMQSFVERFSSFHTRFMDQHRMIKSRDRKSVV